MINKDDLLFDVRARVKIANLCKDKRFENIQMLFDCSEEERIKNVLIMLKILSNSAEYAKRKAQGLEVNVNADYNTIPITLDDMYDICGLEDFSSLREKISATIVGGSTPSVTTESGSKNAEATQDR